MVDTEGSVSSQLTGSDSGGCVCAGRPVGCVCVGEWLSVRISRTKKMLSVQSKCQ